MHDAQLGQIAFCSPIFACVALLALHLLALHQLALHLLALPLLAWYLHALHLLALPSLALHLLAWYLLAFVVFLYVWRCEVAGWLMLSLISVRSASLAC